ncbi:tripartite motif-containing 7-like, partial [Pelobates cultripes]
MASVDLRDELTCSICLNIYTDPVPVTLICGHRFCQDCITKTLDNQSGREYSCPEGQKEVGIPCTYCVHSLVPAAKTCLHCEASLKCSVHKKVLEYYCSKDAVCICVSCRLDGQHRTHKVETLNEASEKKKKKLRNIMEKLTSKKKEAEKRVQNILLDVNTASNDVTVSDDFKTLCRSEISQSRPETSDRFEKNQVLGSRSFSSGRHYWEVESSESGRWIVGMAYPRIARKGRQSVIGYNNKSWGLWRWDHDEYSVIHESKEILLTHRPSSQRLGIYLDYEAGRLSFYELCEPITHLHTFTATFTEPLHAIFGVDFQFLK